MNCELKDIILKKEGMDVQDRGGAFLGRHLVLGRGVALGLHVPGDLSEILNRNGQSLDSGRSDHL